METSKNEPIEIPLSKVKLTWLLMASISFVAISLWILIAQPESIIISNPFFNTILSILGIALFGAAGFFILKKLKDNKPGIILDQKGITVNAGAASFGLIPWTDIQEVKAIVYYNQDLLLIMVKDPAQYIDPQKNVFKKKGMEMSLKDLGTPINISANSLKCNFEQLKNIVQEKFRENSPALRHPV